MKEQPKTVQETVSQALWPRCSRDQVHCATGENNEGWNTDRYWM